MAATKFKKNNNNNNNNNKNSKVNQCQLNSDVIHLDIQVKIVILLVIVGAFPSRERGGIGKIKDEERREKQ